MDEPQVVDLYAAFAGREEAFTDADHLQVPQPLLAARSPGATLSLYILSLVVIGCHPSGIYT